MLWDIFQNNYRRLKKLRTVFSADTVASMVNDRLKIKNINILVTGADIDSFIKMTDLSNSYALVTHTAFKDAMDSVDLGLSEPV